MIDPCPPGQVPIITRIWHHAAAHHRPIGHGLRHRAIRHGAGWWTTAIVCGGTGMTGAWLRENGTLPAEKPPTVGSPSPAYLPPGGGLIYAPGPLPFGMPGGPPEFTPFPRAGILPPSGNFVQPPPSGGEIVPPLGIVPPPLAEIPPASETTSPSSTSVGEPSSMGVLCALAILAFILFRKEPHK